MPFAIRVKLSAMMFLQYLMMPVWFLALGKYMAGLEGSAPWMFWVFNTMAFGMMASPVVCMFADKFLNSERMLLICDVTAALGLFGAAYTSNPGVVFACLLVTDCILNWCPHLLSISYPLRVMVIPIVASGITPTHMRDRKSVV